MYYVIDILGANSLSIDNLPEGCVEYIKDEAERTNSIQHMDGKSFLVLGENPVTGESQISAYYENEKERNIIVSGLMHTSKDYMKAYVDIFNYHRSREIEGPAAFRRAGNVGNSFQQQLAY